MLRHISLEVKNECPNCGQDALKDCKCPYCGWSNVTGYEYVELPEKYLRQNARRREKENDSRKKNASTTCAKRHV